MSKRPKRNRSQSSGSSKDSKVPSKRGNRASGKSGTGSSKVRSRSRKNYNKSDLIRDVQGALFELEVDDRLVVAEYLVDTVLNAMRGALLRRYNVVFPKLFSIQVYRASPYEYVHPKTRAVCKVRGRLRCKFRASGALNQDLIEAS